MKILVHHPDKGINFLVISSDEELICDYCKAKIDLGEQIVFCKTWTYSYLIKKYLCPDCSRKFPDLFIGTQILAYVTEVLPPKCIFFNESAPLLVTGTNLLTTDIEGINKAYSGAQTIDKTKLAGRETWEGCQVGMNPQEAIEQHDAGVRLAEIEDFLRDGKPVLIGQGKEGEKKQIEGGAK